MKYIKAVLAALALSTQVNAVTVFTDNFNTENGGTPALNYAGFANWTISAGTVDLIGSGSGGTAFNLYPGNGLYVDLDGSTGNAGVMTSSAIAVAPGNYELSFLLGGNARGGPNDTVNLSVNTGFGGQIYNLASSDPLALRTYAFTVTSATSINLVFENLGNDNVGAILDNVRLNTVPEGGQTAMLFALGLTALGWARKRLK